MCKALIMLGDSMEKETGNEFVDLKLRHRENVDIIVSCEE